MPDIYSVDFGLLGSPRPIVFETDDQPGSRLFAKSVNFGIVYGVSPQILHKKLQSLDFDSGSLIVSENTPPDVITSARAVLEALDAL